MKAMKKSVAILLAVCMIVPMFVLAAFTVSADDTDPDVPEQSSTGVGSTTITVGVINYLIDEIGENNWQVHYWNSSLGSNDVALNSLGTTVQKDVGYWETPQDFKMFTAVIPDDAQGYKVHNGERWFGGDGPMDKPVAFVFYYDSDKAVYEYEDQADEDGFYVVGDFNGWKAKKSYKLELNPNDQTGSEYMLKGVTLVKDQEFKVVKYSVSDDISAYYPGDGTTNYIVGTTGNYDVYFRNDGSGDQNYGWHYGYIYLGYSPIVGNTLQVDGGDIAVNFYFALTAEQAAEGPTYIFDCNGKSSDLLHITADNYSARYNDVLNLYKTTCNVAPAEMTDEIFASFTLDGTGDQTAQWYGFEGFSAKACAMSYVNGNYVGGSDVRVKNLAIAMLNYGTACQTQFNHNVDDLANADLDNADKNTSVLTAEEQAELANVNVPDKAEINGNESVTGYGVEYKGLTLFVQSKTTLRFYFEVKDTGKYNDDTKGRISIGTETEKPYDGNAKYVYVDWSNIGAPYLGIADRLYVNEANFGPYSALSYVKAALSDGSGADDNLKSTVSALYRYHKAAAGLNDAA